MPRLESPVLTKPMLTLPRFPMPALRPPWFATPKFSVRLPVLSRNRPARLAPMFAMPEPKAGVARSSVLVF